jgi:hypothetical protein
VPARGQRGVPEGDNGRVPEGDNGGADEVATGVPTR